MPKVEIKQTAAGASRELQYLAGQDGLQESQEAELAQEKGVEEGGRCGVGV